MIDSSSLHASMDSCKSWVSNIALHPSPALLVYTRRNDLYPQPIRYDLFHYWDNWVTWDETTQLYHRYAQSAPKGIPTVNFEHHSKAEIRHLVSEDGENWWDLGRVLGKKSPNDMTYWSGSVLVHGDLFYLFHTRANKTTGDQVIALAKSKDGHHFEEADAPILRPQERFGYDFTTDNGVIQAWRDPNVIWDDEAKHWVMVFATKVRPENSEVPYAAVGRAFSENLRDWELAPPIESPLIPGIEIEIPIIIENTNGSHELLFNMVDPKTRATWFFRWPGDSASGPFRRVAELQNSMTDPQFYGAHVFRRKEGQYGMVGFSTSRHEKAFHLTGIEPFPEYGNSVQLKTLSQGIESL